MGITQCPIIGDVQTETHIHLKAIEENPVSGRGWNSWDSPFPGSGLMALTSISPHLLPDFSPQITEPVPGFVISWQLQCKCLRCFAWSGLRPVSVPWGYQGRGFSTEIGRTEQVHLEVSGLLTLGKSFHLSPYFLFETLPGIVAVWAGAGWPSCYFLWSA